MKEEQIGNQRLIFDNAMESMRGGIWKVDHIITDPPYEQSLHDIKTKKTRKLKKDGSTEIQKIDFQGIDAIRKEFIDIAQDITEGWFITFCTIEGVARWADVINPSKMKYKRACIWVKPDAIPQLNGQGPAQGAECFVTAWCGQGYSKWNGGGKKGVYTFFTKPKDRDGRHPTEKPVKLMSQLVVDFTQPQQTILDPFMGSGTTLVSCQRTGRYGIGIEKSKEYFDIACERVHRAWSQPDMFVDTTLDIVPIKARQHKIL